jgi:hypothetical protein
MEVKVNSDKLTWAARLTMKEVTPGDTLVVQHGKHLRTIEDFERAVAGGGADGIEYDLALCADGAVVLHLLGSGLDLTIDGVPIAEMRLERLSRKLGYRPPLHSELLDLIPLEWLVDAELKEVAAAAPAIRELRLARDMSTVLVTSSLDQAVATANRAGALTGLILRGKRASDLSPKERLRASRAQFIVPNHRLARWGRDTGAARSPRWRGPQTATARYDGASKIRW